MARFGNMKPKSSGITSVRHSLFSKKTKRIIFECGSQCKVLLDKMVSLAAGKVVLNPGRVTSITSPVPKAPEVHNEMATPVDVFGAIPSKDRELRTTAGMREALSIDVRAITSPEAVILDNCAPPAGNP